MKIRSCSMCLADWLTASGIEYGWIKLFQMKISVSFTSLPPTVKWKNRRRKPKPVGCHLSSCLQFHTMSIRSHDSRCQLGQMMADVKEISIEVGQPSSVILDAGSVLLMDICVCSYCVRLACQPINQQCFSLRLPALVVL